MALTTRYSKKLDRLNPYPEYPRPSLVRNSFLSLNGIWDFYTSDIDTDHPEFNEKILVPFPPESSLSEIGRSVCDKLYYRRYFKLPDGFINERVILHFGAVDQIADVWLNGKYLGEHKGGYLPFSFDITEALTEEENELTVKATDTLSRLYPYGKQTKKRGGMWYTEVSGIWQSVWIESVPKNYIKSLKITPSLTSAKIEVMGAAGEKELTLKESGKSYKFTENEIEIFPDQIRNWSPESPYLYYFTLKCGSDEIESYFALRSIETKEVDGVPRLCLNGKPYLFHGLLDQGYYPDGIFLPATIEGYIDDIMTAKRLGFNTLRKHIKIEPEIFYHLCDTLGIVVFQDMVNNSSYSFIRDTALPTVFMKTFPDNLLHRNKASRRIFTEHTKDTLAHLYNTPSILYYTIFNEGWGQFSADTVYTLVKELDKTRIIDSTSGWFTRKLSDVESHHVYFKKLRAKKTSRPVVISEFGGFSYRCEGHLFGEKNYGYSTYKSLADFTEAVKRLYLEEALPLVKKCVSALIYTQVSDVEDETNGFLTYDREVLKISAEDFLPISEALINSLQKKEKNEP